MRLPASVLWRLGGMLRAVPYPWPIMSHQCSVPILTGTGQDTRIADAALKDFRHFGARTQPSFRRPLERGLATYYLHSDLAS